MKKTRKLNPIWITKIYVHPEFVGGRQVSEGYFKTINPSYVKEVHGLIGYKKFKNERLLALQAKGS